MTPLDKRFLAPLFLAGAISLTSACAPGSSTPSVSGAATAVPTVQAAATALAPTVQAVVPTAQAAATLLAPTAQALATQVAPAAQAAAQTATAVSPISLEGARLDLFDSTLTLRNKSTQQIDLSNHQIRVGTTSVPLPANARIQPGGILTIHTAGGTGDAANVYLGDEARALITSLRPGASVALIRDDGQRTAEFTIPGI